MAPKKFSEIALAGVNAVPNDTVMGVNAAGQDVRWTPAQLAASITALVVGTTAISGGTTGRVLYDNAGVLGEYTNTQLTALINPVTALLSGAIPAFPGNTTTFFRGDGTYAALPGSFTGFANPTASVGLTAVNGTATTAMRSDAAPALDQTPAYAFSGLGATTISQQGSSASTLTLTGGTVTTSQPLINATQTWNAGAVTFTGLKLNVTNTASAVASKHFDIQQGGVSAIYFDINNGNSAAALNLTSLANNFNPTIKFRSGVSDTVQAIITNEAAGTLSMFSTTSRMMQMALGGLTVRSDAYYGWAPAADTRTAPDLQLTRAAAATLQLGATNGASPVPQILQVQNAATANNNGAATWTNIASLSVGNGTSGDHVFSTGKNGNGSGVLATVTEALRIKGETQAVIVAAGKTFQLGATAVTGLIAGALAALTNASLTLTDATGTVYRIPCVTP